MQDGRVERPGIGAEGKGPGLRVHQPTRDQGLGRADPCRQVGIGAGEGVDVQIEARGDLFSWGLAYRALLL